MTNTEENKPGTEPEVKPEAKAETKLENKSGMTPGLKPETKGGSKSGEIVLICAIIGFLAALSMLLPPVRNFVFHGGGGAAVTLPDRSGDAIAVETPRSQFPMGQYTLPSIFKKMRFTVEENDGSRRGIFYYWYAPKGLPAGVKLPLVVVLHDKAGLASGAIYLRSTAVQKEFPSFLLIPQAPATKVWASPKKYLGQEFGAIPPSPVQPEELQSMSDVISLVARLTEAAAIDENRIYIIGCDEGGSGVYGAAAHFPGIFAAGVAIGGRWSFLDAPKLAKTPLLMLQGLTDTVVTPEYTRNMKQYIKNANGSMFIGEFPNTGHDCESPNYYSHAVWKWLFAQRRPAPQPPPQQAVAPSGGVPVAQ
jgi:predicted esterase